jgi:hypothetical protein
MVKLEIISDMEDVTPIIETAISTEIKRLEIGLRKTEREIQRFEEKYSVSSDVFLNEYAAEDLEGGDEEYIQWAGEIEIQHQILEDLRKLQAIEYVTK